VADLAGDDQQLSVPTAGGEHGTARVSVSLAAFVLLARFLGVAADPDQIAHQRGRGDDPYSLDDLARVAKSLGLIARVRDVSVTALAKLPLPAMIDTGFGDAVILLKIEDDAISPRYLVQHGLPAGCCWSRRAKP
jgi:ATP-binding cassette, subfamily B, bacterial HlyB/CyaB